MSDLKAKLSSLRIEATPRRGRRRLLGWIVFAAALVAVAAFAVRARLNAPVEVSTARAARISAQEAAAGPPTLTASGYLVPRRKAVVSSKIQGRLSELRVEEGSRVAAGEVIARLESSDYEAQIRRAAANIERAKAAIVRAEADLAEYRRQMRKSSDLADQGVVSTDSKEAAASRVTVAEAVLEQTRRERTVADTEKMLAEANFANTTIRAPFAGTVVRKMAEVGESVAPIPPGVNISTASGAIVVLADLDTLEAEVDVGERDVAQLVPAQPAFVTVEAFRDRKFRGVLRQVMPSADRTRATVLVRVTLVDKDKDLKPEMSARADFLEREAPAPSADGTPAVVAVPKEAVVSRDGATQVFAVSEGRVRAVTVTTGDERKGQVIVRSGLTGDETVVLKPSEALRDGDAVRVK